jgi:hypothetical protein
MNAFHDALDACNLVDIGFVGDAFTWHRGDMRERLDRALANQAWTQSQDKAALLHLEYNHFDHRPLLMDTEYYAAQRAGTNRAQRQFEAKWFREEGFAEIVEANWNAADTGQSPINVLDRLKAMHAGLHAWDGRVLKQPIKRLRQAQHELEVVMRGPINPENQQKKFELAQQIERLLEQEEIRWCQRSRANWIQNGDRNTTFFHHFASARRNRNLIKQLKDPTGNFVEGIDQLNPIILDYFSNLFSTDMNVVEPDFLEKVVPKVTEDMNEKLISPFTAEDVKKAGFSIGDLKAPGLDGLHALFYKKFWHLVGNEIIVAVLKAINERAIPNGWNETVIVLIPKVDNPLEVLQFRPISLCNVVYKIISKLLATRLKVILPDTSHQLRVLLSPGD